MAIKINNQEKIAKAKETIINLEKKAATDDKPGLWGFAFKWLILDFGKKITLNEIEKAELIKDLEDRLKRVEKDVWLAENVVSLLAEYYANEKDEDNLMRVLDVLEKSLKTNDRTNSDALLKMHAYEKIHEIYQKYKDKGFQKAKSASDRISQEIGQLDLDWNKSFKEISVTTEIKQKDIDDFLKAIFGDKEQGKLETIIAKIVVNFLPKKETVEKQLKDVSGKHPLQFLCTTQVVSDDGIPIAKLSTLEEDYDNHFQRYASQYLQFGSFFLTLATDELKNRVSKQNITEYFSNSTLFGNDNKEYLERAISAYWDNDYLIASHLFNPLIESAIRELVKNCGGIILKPNNLGGYDRLTLCQLLKGQGNIIENIFSGMGQSMDFYFRLVLTEKLGMNLRNDFAHGFGKKKFFARNVSDRLFHVMVCLSLVKKREENNMNRTRKMFFAFVGKEPEQTEKISEIQDGYEFWNLKKFVLDEFVEELKKKIPPVNNNVIHNYKVDSDSREPYAITEEQFKKCSWGLLIPDTLEEGGFSYAETLFILNLYSPNFLYPCFYVNDMGIMRQKHDKDSMIYFHTQDYSIFNNKNFVEFYKILFEQSKYGSWHLDRIKLWNKEDWRLFIAAFLYSGLKDYENSKSLFGWQRESAEMATILEALFTADDSRNEEVMYRLRKRIAALLAWKFPDIEKDIKELYEARSAFVHGSFFKQIAKESPGAYNNLPSPDFNLLYKHKEYVRVALAAYLNLAKIVSLENIDNVKSVMDALEESIIDFRLREKLISETKTLFDFMPEPRLKSEEKNG
ncbi:MAG: DUF4209 domain-containing protein [Candidatus Pacebacteria bacterium]|nr:DUF4209 domain-containing protein [Candidatus Paceibacterota bacterium]